jgi:putative aminopeptidase FrvX
VGLLWYNLPALTLDPPYRSERRASILENPTILIGVCIEYMHGVLGATKVEHMERTEETINGQLCNFDNIAKAQER